MELALLDQKSTRSFDNHDLNTYEGIAEYYDTLMTDGYYDYNQISDSLCQVIGDRTDILELGVGTGLVVEKVLERKPNFKITGIDNTQAMIEKAKIRIGDRMTYELQDVTTLNLENKFEAAFSVGGCWYFIDNGIENDLEFCSHIDDLKASLNGLQNVVNHLKPGAVLAFALQSPHHNYSKKISNELVYSQEIFEEEEGFTKHYAFKKEGKVLAEQFYRYLVFPESKIHDFFHEIGCKPLGLCPSRKFFAYEISK